jgi:beta-1,4-N-acetylglucosaminyltransferase
MIFVTVGTNDFESLIASVDKLPSKINEEIICQVGNNKYLPSNCEYFRFRNSLEPYFNKASLVITHGGAGTLFRLLELRKKVIAVDNFECQGLHQRELLKKLADKGYILWCNNMEKLEKLIIEMRHLSFNLYNKPICTIAQHIELFINEK